MADFGNFVSAEMRGTEEYTDVLNTPDIITTAEIINGLPDAFTRCFHFVGGSSREGLTFDGVSVATSNHLILSCYLKFTDLSPLSEYLFMKSTGGGSADVTSASFINFYLETDGDVRVTDTGGSTFATITTPFTVDTWHFVEIRIFPETGTDGDGEVQVWVDGVEALSNQTGLNLTTYVNHKGLAVGGSPTSGEQVYFAGINLIYNSTSATDRVTGSNADQRWEAVGPYTNNAGATATPDDDGPGTGGGGDNLDSGNWDDVDDIPFADATPAIYSSASNGSVYTDGGSFAGPSGDPNIDGDSNMKVVKYMMRAERGSGSPSSHRFYVGNDVDSPGGDGEFTPSLTTSPANYVLFSQNPTVLPLSTQNARMGFGRVSGAQAIEMRDMAAFVLHLPSLSVTVGLVLKGWIRGPIGHYIGR